jgi:hypothetical protein
VDAIAVKLVLAFVLFGAGALDEVANVIVQILQVVFELLVRLINLFVELLKSMGWALKQPTVRLTTPTSEGQLVHRSSWKKKS